MAKKSTTKSTTKATTKAATKTATKVATKAATITNVVTEVKPIITGKNFPTDWLEQIELIIAGARKYQIDFGEQRNPNGLELHVTNLQNMDKEITDLEITLASLRDRRRAVRAQAWQEATNLRAAIGALFGKDSEQYQAVGGTRQSERKSPVRKPKAKA